MKTRRFRPKRNHTKNRVIVFNLKKKKNNLKFPILGIVINIIVCDRARTAPVVHRRVVRTNGIGARRRRGHKLGNVTGQAATTCVFYFFETQEENAIIIIYYYTTITNRREYTKKKKKEKRIIKKKKERKIRAERIYRVVFLIYFFFF